MNYQQPSRKKINCVVLKSRMQRQINRLEQENHMLRLNFNAAKKKIQSYRESDNRRRKYEYDYLPYDDDERRD